MSVHMHQRVGCIKIGFGWHQADWVIVLQAIFVCKPDSIIQVLQTALNVFLGVLQKGEAVIDFK